MDIETIIEMGAKIHKHRTAGEAAQRRAANAVDDVQCATAGALNITTLAHLARAARRAETNMRKAQREKMYEAIYTDDLRKIAQADNVNLV